MEINSSAEILFRESKLFDVFHADKLSLIHKLRHVRTFRDAQATLISYITLLIALHIFTSCFIACDLLEDLPVNSIVRRVEILLDLFQKLFIVVMGTIILFNLVRHEAWYHGQLVFLQEDLG